MKGSVLDIQNLQIIVEEKVVLQNFALTLDRGEVGAIVGPNGSGKSSLAMALVGDPRYKITGELSKIYLDNVEISKMKVDERSRLGLFVSWQAPIQIPGVSVFSLCKEMYLAHGKKISSMVDFRNKIEKLAAYVGLEEKVVTREVNVGFSGGERKRLELVQLLLIVPKVAVLDELDSGLDTNGVDKLIEIIQTLKAKGTSIVLITHNQKLIDKLGVGKVWKTIN